MYTVDELPLRPQSTSVIAASSSQRIATAGTFVRFSVGTKALWYKFGTVTVTATAGTASEGFVPQDYALDVPIPLGSTHVAIIQNAATAIGSVTVF